MHSAKLTIDVRRGVFNHIIQDGSTCFTLILGFKPEHVVVFGHSIPLAFNFSNCAVAHFNDLVQFVFVVDTVVWRCTGVHFQVTFSIDSDTGDRGIHSS